MNSDNKVEYIKSPANNRLDNMVSREKVDASIEALRTEIRLRNCDRAPTITSSSVDITIPANMSAKLTIHFKNSGPTAPRVLYSILCKSDGPNNSVVQSALCDIRPNDFVMLIQNTDGLVAKCVIQYVLIFE